MSAFKRPSVFISSSYADNADARALAHLLQADAEVHLWTDTTGTSGPAATESLFELLRTTDFAVAILTGHDVGSFAPSSRANPRMNVVFELGLFLGSLGPSRVFALARRDEPVDLPSDLTGLSILTYDGRDDPQVGLAQAAEQIRSSMAQTKGRPEKAEDVLSCFISYSSTDRAFAEKLSNGLQQAGIRGWLDVKDLTIGSRWEEQIDRAIKIHDKMLFVLSDRSVHSPWVKLEVAKALSIEKTRTSSFLIPVRIDDSIFGVTAPWATQLRDRQIGDFRDWQDGIEFNRAVSRLVRDLMISASFESRERSDA